MIQWQRSKEWECLMPGVTPNVHKCFNPGPFQLYNWDYQEYVYIKYDEGWEQGYTDDADNRRIEHANSENLDHKSDTFYLWPVNKQRNTYAFCKSSGDKHPHWRECLYTWDFNTDDYVGTALNPDREDTPGR